MASRSVSSLRNASLLFLVVGCLISVSFTMGQIVPLWISILVLACSGGFFLYFLATGKVGAISVLLFIFVALPFIHVLPYLFYNVGYPAPTATWKPNDPTIWGLATNPYSFDIETIKLTAELGAAAVSGLLAGMFAAYAKQPTAVRMAVPVTKTLNIFWFFVLLGLALFASKLAAPAHTIFEEAYAGKGTAAEALNFGSLGLVSYAFLILCLADAVSEDRRRTRLLKLVVLAISILYVVIWLQFARGDRESITLVIASAIMFWIWGVPRVAKQRTTIISLRLSTIVLVFAVLAVGLELQQLRPNLAGKNLGDILTTAREVASSDNPVGTRMSDVPTPEAALKIDSLKPAIGRGVIFDRVDKFIPKGTWSSVLLTPLSVAGDDVRGLLPLRLGRTYLDLLLSTPPGFVADRLGYHRPIDLDHGPAHEMRYGQGGTHAVVVPFMNFRVIGVVLILALWGGLFAKLEQLLSSAKPPLAVQKIAAYGIICTIIPQWIWYSDKILITGGLICVIVSAAYFVAVRLPPSSSRRLSTA